MNIEPKEKIKLIFNQGKNHTSYINTLLEVKSGHWTWYIFPSSVTDDTNYKLNKKDIKFLFDNFDTNDNCKNIISYLIMSCNAILYNLIYITNSDNYKLLRIMGTSSHSDRNVKADVNKFMASILMCYFCFKAIKNDVFANYFKLVFNMCYEIPMYKNSNDEDINNYGHNNWFVKINMEKQMRIIKEAYPEKIKQDWTAITCNKDKCNYTNIKIKLIGDHINDKDKIKNSIITFNYKTNYTNDIFKTLVNTNNLKEMIKEGEELDNFHIKDNFYFNYYIRSGINSFIKGSRYNKKFKVNDLVYYLDEGKKIELYKVTKINPPSGKIQNLSITLIDKDGEVITNNQEIKTTSNKIINIKTQKNSLYLYGKKFKIYKFSTKKNPFY